MSWLRCSKHLGVLMRRQYAELRVKGGVTGNAAPSASPTPARSSFTLRTVHHSNSSKRFVSSLISKRERQELLDSAGDLERQEYLKVEKRAMYKEYIEEAVSWYDLLLKLSIFPLDSRFDEYLPIASRRFTELGQVAEDGLHRAAAELDVLFREDLFRSILPLLARPIWETGINLVRSHKMLPNEIAMFMRGLSVHVPKKDAWSWRSANLQICVRRMVDEKAEMTRLHLLEGLLGASRFPYLDVEALLTEVENRCQDDLSGLTNLELIYLGEVYNRRMQLGRLHVQLLDEFRRRIPALDGRLLESFIRSTDLLSILSKSDLASLLTKADEHLAPVIDQLPPRNLAALCNSFEKVEYQPSHIHFSLWNSYLDHPMFATCLFFALRQKNVPTFVFPRLLVFIENNIQILDLPKLERILDRLIAGGISANPTALKTMARLISKEVARRVSRSSKFPPAHAAALFLRLLQLSVLAAQLRNALLSLSFSGFAQLDLIRVSDLVQGLCHLDNASEYNGSLRAALGTNGLPKKPMTGKTRAAFSSGLVNLNLPGEKWLRPIAEDTRASISSLHAESSSDLSHLVTVLHSLAYFGIDYSEFVSDACDWLESTHAELPQDALYSVEMVKMAYSLCSLGRYPLKTLSRLLKCDASFIPSLSHDGCILLRDVNELAKQHGGVPLLARSAFTALEEKLLPHFQKVHLADSATFDRMCQVLPKGHVRPPMITKELYCAASAVLKSTDATSCAWPANLPEYLSKADVGELQEQGKTPVALLSLSQNSFIWGTKQLTRPATMACMGLKNSGWKVITVNFGQNQYVNNASLRAQLTKAGFVLWDVCSDRIMRGWVCKHAICVAVSLEAKVLIGGRPKIWMISSHNESRQSV